MEGSTSKPAPAKANSSTINKETEPSASTSKSTSANESTDNKTSASTSKRPAKPPKARGTTSKEKAKLNPSTESKEKELGEMIIKKSKKHFCYKKNDTWWNIEISANWKWCIVTGDFGTALCYYRLCKNTFEFEVYTDISCSKLDEYKTSILLDIQGTKKTRTPKTEFKEEYDWKLTKKDWKESFKSKEGKIKVNICLKNQPKDAGSNTETE